jgi:hypothetical protein
MTRKPILWTTLLGLIAAAVTTSCASTSSVHPAPNADYAEGAGSDVITTAELRRLDQGMAVIDVVEHARPWFLHPRGSVSMVSIDNAPPADPSVLRSMTVGDVREIRLLHTTGRSGPVAIRADGWMAVGDVVLVVTEIDRR